MMEMLGDIDVTGRWTQHGNSMPAHVCTCYRGDRVMQTVSYTNSLRIGLDLHYMATSYTVVTGQLR